MPKHSKTGAAALVPCKILLDGLPHVFYSPLWDPPYASVLMCGLCS